jgi:magnesium chelatase subunit D
MTGNAADPASPWIDAVLAAAFAAIDPAGCGGVVVRASAGPVRDRWLALLRSYLPEGAPNRRVPAHVHDDRLLGGLDLVATLRAGRPVAERGLLAEAHGGAVIVAGAERVGSLVAARFAAACDTGEVALERDGVTLRMPARFLLVALDEGIAEDERPPTVLRERLAFHVTLEAVGLRDSAKSVVDPRDLAEARGLLPRVTIADEFVQALCATGIALGVASLRAPLMAVRAACAAAALDGRTFVEADDTAIAARLVFAARATMLPAAPEEPAPQQESPPPEQAPPEDAEQQKSTPEEVPLDDVVLAATAAAIPPGLLAQLQIASAIRSRAQSGGRAGEERQSGTRGRPAGVRRGEPRRGARLNVVETLRAAAPWQSLRRRASPATADGQRARVEVRRDDFRVNRYKRHTRTTTIFVVDASGSAALHRLGEAKGAVELLLAECYVRRDRVALVAFRGPGAELILPPTRSLARAKRSLAGLPGGGGTPLASGIEAAIALADATRRQGDTPLLVFLTDGRANLTTDGKPDRAAAEAQALAAARRVRADGLRCLLVDTAPRPQPLAERVAEQMGAKYLPLPHARSTSLNVAIRGVLED